MINFDVRLGDTYWSKGFFNVSVDFQRYLTMTEGLIKIFLGDAAQPILGRISRSANTNATPRIFGNKRLAVFFQGHFKRGDLVSVEIISSDAVRIAPGLADRSRVVKPTSTPRLASATASSRVVSAEQLATWRRTLIGILNELERSVPRVSDEGVAKRIQRLSYGRLIPREVAAMMRVVTEMRNITEYESKVLSASESAAVSSAWAAIRSWADSRKSRT